MEEQSDNIKIIIKLDYLYEILSDFYFIAKIRYEKNGNINDENYERDYYSKQKNIFKYFKNNIDDNNFNLFKNHKNIFQIEDNKDSYFNSDLYYYSRNESMSVMEIDKKQNNFFLFYENFYKVFKLKILELTNDETFYYNYYHKIYHKDYNLNEKKINQNLYKIINNNISNNNIKQTNFNKNNSKYFFYYDDETNKSNFFTADMQNIKFLEFLKNQNLINSSCKMIFDLKNYIGNLKDVFFVIKNKEHFKNFFFEFLNDVNNDESINYNTYNYETKKNIDNINSDFLRFLSTLWSIIKDTFYGEKFFNKKFMNEKCNHNFKDRDVLIKIKYENDNVLKHQLEEVYKKRIKDNLFMNCSIDHDSTEIFPKTLILFIIMELEEQFFLGFYNISKRIFHPDEFNLHKAIYENNLKKINDICKNESNENIFCKINEIDSEGNSPLLFAIKLNRLDAIKILCDNNAEIKHSFYNGSTTPFDYAIMNKNRDVLKILINAFKKQKLSFWHQNQKDIADVLKTIPDFSLVFTVSLNSTLFSVIQSITPKDIFKVSKKDSTIRIDMNISSLNTALKVFKGKSSFIIQEEKGKIKIKKMDYQKKISYDYIDSITEIKDDENKLEELIAEGWKTKKLNDINLKMHPQINKKKDEKILGYESQNIIAKGIIYWIKRKLNKKKFNEILSNEKKKFKSFLTYEDYTKIRDQDFIYKMLEKNHQYLLNKYNKFINNIEIQNFTKIINLKFDKENKYYNFQNNDNNLDNVKKSNPLLFSFGNKEIFNPTEMRKFGNYSNNLELKNDENNIIHENKNLFLNLLLNFSDNSDIIKFIENDLIEKGFTCQQNISNKDFTTKNNMNFVKSRLNMINECNIKQLEFSGNDTKKDKILFNTLNIKSSNFDQNNFKNYSNNDLKKNFNNLNINNHSNIYKASKLINSNSHSSNHDFFNINSYFNNPINFSKDVIVEKKISQKELSLNLLTSKDFPIKIYHFIPLIHILSFTSSEFSQLNRILCANILPFDTFPLKIDFPLGLSLIASLNITEFKSDIIQDISISDFQKENISGTYKNNNKDISSNENHSTTLDDKYAKEFYDRYFKEKQVEAFSEFSEESLNKENYLRGSKTNYSELFRDEEFPEDRIENEINKNNENINKEYILTELKYEDENENRIFFENRNEKTYDNFNLNTENKFFKLNLNVSKELSPNEKKYIEINSTKKNHSIATNNYKNKKIIINSSKNNLFKNNLNDKDFFLKEIKKTSKIVNVSPNNSKIFNYKKISNVKKIDNNYRDTFNNKNKKIIITCNNGKRDIGTNHDLYDENFYNDSDLQKTLEENTTLNLSKLNTKLKYNKPPQFKQRIKSYLKMSDKKFKPNANNNMKICNSLSQNNYDNNNNYNKFNNRNINNFQFCNNSNFNDFHSQLSSFNKVFTTNNLIINNTINNLDKDIYKNIRNHQISSIDKYKYFDDDYQNDIYNSIYIPASELNNYNIPTYSNADNEFDKMSCMDKTHMYNFNKIEKNLISHFNENNINDFNSIRKNKTLHLKDNKNYIYSKNFVMKNSKTININKRNRNTIKNEFDYQNVNTENLNFDTISICTKNENNTENYIYKTINNDSVNDRIEKINNISNLNKKYFERPGTNLKKYRENASINNFNTINHTNETESNFGHYNDDSIEDIIENEIDENKILYEENIPMEKTIFNKINNMKILPIKFLSNTLDSSLLVDKNNNNQIKLEKKVNLKKKIPIPKYYIKNTFEILKKNIDNQ